MILPRFRRRKKMFGLATYKVTVEDSSRKRRVIEVRAEDKKWAEGKARNKIDWDEEIVSVELAS
jgi:hypothetical protein